MSNVCVCVCARERARFDEHKNIQETKLLIRNENSHILIGYFMEGITR